MTIDLLDSKKWVQWGLFNLVVVALYGMLMRYKIAYDFPFFEQKNLLHAHSHFAFNGWISQMLYSSLALILFPYLSSAKRKKYNWLLIANLCCSYGMLIAFTAQGYHAISISFSSLAIVVAFVFCFSFIVDARNTAVSKAVICWASTGLILNLISVLGPACLAYMMASNNINSHLYLGSVYYYLHFQYSGWFFFASMALLIHNFSEAFGSVKKYYTIFTITVVPTFFLSILWVKLPLWLYILTVIASILQLVAWLTLLIKLFAAIQKNKKLAFTWYNILFYTAGIAMSIKFLLQAISVIPSLSQLVFGIRPIVIAYLHLILLGAYSTFILGYLFKNGYLKISVVAKYASLSFVMGVLINEILLAIQGFTAFFYIPIPHVNGMLLFAAVVLCSSAAALWYSQVRTKAVPS